MGYFFYNIFSTMAFVVILPLLPLILLCGKRFRDGLCQRLGIYEKTCMARVRGARPVWIHAASVGEVRSATPLVREIRKRYPGIKIMLTTFTPTGNRIARAVGSADLVLFLPLDLWWVARRAVKKLNPLAVLIIETEIWPNLLNEAYKRGIPVVLLSGRLSARALKRYQLLKEFFRHVIDCFTAVGMQSADDRERIMQLGASADKVSIVGNLKYGLCEGGALNAGPGSANLPRSQPLLVVGSSHRGEEEIFIDVFRLLKRQFTNLQMVLAPRHPQRFNEIEKLLKLSGLSFDRKSTANGGMSFRKDVMFLDTLGELEQFYAVADIVFVGGSLVNAGGHNLLEPARFCKPILFGPYMENFSSVAEEIKQAGAGIEVRGKDDLFREITELLNDPRRRKRLGEKAYTIAANDHGALESNLALAARYLR